MNEYLIAEIKKMSGNLIGIGVNNEKIKNAILKNDQIMNCYLLDKGNSSWGKKKFQIFNRGKTINIKKIKKVFKKKRIDNLICNYQIIDPFLKTFVRDSVYINKNKLYIYGPKENLTELKNKYQRYTENIKMIEKKDGYILVVDNTNTTNNKIKDILYWWQDTLAQLANFLTAILVN